jgi:hypothetical protein
MPFYTGFMLLTNVGIFLYLQVRLNHRKESTVPLASDCTTPDSRLGDVSPGADMREFKTYPFALVLRLRVLQVSDKSLPVCYKAANIS